MGVVQRLGLLIPEFPTQTHIAMWRLGAAMRRAGADVRVLSTRRPKGEAPVHPALAEEAARTFYCWPASLARSWPRRCGRRYGCPRPRGTA
ncbi:MAG: hypothetical protein R3B68_05540 [Phycisphaerales bacterium]